MLTATLRLVIATLPGVTIKYDVADTPEAGGIVKRGVERVLTDATLLAAIQDAVDIVAPPASGITVRAVVAEFVDGALPRVVVKYDQATPAAPELGPLTDIMSEIEDPAIRTMVAGMAASLAPSTSALLGIPLVVPNLASAPA